MGPSRPSGRGRPWHQLIRRRLRSGQGLAQSEPHGDDLLLLLDDDFLSDAAKPLIVPMAQFGVCHVNRALMVRHHHCDEVLIDVTRRVNGHAIHHSRHSPIVFRQKGGFLFA